MPIIGALLTCHDSDVSIGLKYAEKLIDLKNEDVGPIDIQKSIPGKKIKSVEVLVKLED